MKLVPGSHCCFRHGKSFSIRQTSVSWARDGGGGYLSSGYQNYDCSCRQCWVGQDSGKSCLVIAELAIPAPLSAASSQMVCRKMLPPYIASGVVRQTTPEAIYGAMLLCSTVRQTTSGYRAILLCTYLSSCWCVYQIWQCRQNKSLNSRGSPSYCEVMNPASWEGLSLNSVINIYNNL